MHDLPNDALALLVMVYALGLKHGLDPDHLATIDGLARFNAARRPRLARWSGFLFSLGHGLVVMLVAVAVGLIARKCEVPGWLEDLGAWISIGFLLSLGVANLAAVFRTPPDQVVGVAGFRSRLLGPLARTSHPVVIAAIGALFALSFDTMSQAAVFSLAASTMAGWGFACVLGAVFTLGMLTTDGANGLWVAKLLRSADRRALVASRVMGITIACLSLSIGAFGAARYFAPGIDAFAEGRETLFGVLLIAVLAVNFAIVACIAPDRRFALRSRERQRA